MVSPLGVEPRTNRLRVILPPPLLALQAQGMWWAQRRAVLSPKGPNNQALIGRMPERQGPQMKRRIGAKVTPTATGIFGTAAASPTCVNRAPEAAYGSRKRLDAYL